MSNVTLNEEQKVYVIPSGDGYSCWGFDNAIKETRALAKRLGEREPLPEERGTLALYDYHSKLIGQLSQSGRDLGTWFNAGTPTAVRKALELARKEYLTVRIWTGDTTTGRSWLEECDVIGQVGRSMGPLKIPLLVPKGKQGGGGILDDCIIRIVDVESRRELYRHRKFHLPELRIVENPIPHSEHEGKYPWAVTADDPPGEQACFKTYAKAAHYIAFMHGDSFVPTCADNDEEI